MNEIGRVVENEWKKLPERFPDIDLDEYIVMPNHFHGVIWIRKSVGPIHELALPSVIDPRTRRRMLLPRVMGYFKMNSAKRINIIRNLQGLPVWQPDYYEHVIRTEESLQRIRSYVRRNPLEWETDRENIE
jgi:REP element-mobilizing transposase RayT